jgi:hypothetical protein
MPSLPGTHLITVGIYNKLAADATLIGLLPDGVWLEVAMPSSTGVPRTKFAIVSHVPISRDVGVFGRRAYEEHLYMVKAVTRDLSPKTANSAADRINELLEDTPIAVEGYTWMTTHRTDWIELQEIDDADPKLAWQHRGGHFKVQYALL